jgi:hypothetical protein
MSFPSTPYSKHHSPWVDNAGHRVDATTQNDNENLLALLGAVVPATNGVMVWDGTQFRADAGIKNANVDAAAAIALSKLADPGSGNVITSVGAGAIAAKPPGYEIVAFQQTTDTTVTSAAFADIGSFSAATYENTKYYLEFFGTRIRNSAAGNVTIFALFEGASQVGNTISIDAPVADTVGGVPLFVRFRFTPTAGVHTYKVAWKSSAGTSTFKATSDAPGEFRIVKA